MGLRWKRRLRSLPPDAEEAGLPWGRPDGGDQSTASPGRPLHPDPLIALSSPWLGRDGSPSEAHDTCQERLMARSRSSIYWTRWRRRDASSLNRGRVPEKARLGYAQPLASNVHRMWRKISSIGHLRPARFLQGALGLLLSLLAGLGVRAKVTRKDANPRSCLFVSSSLSLLSLSSLLSSAATATPAPPNQAA
jgi:hypothetical protein